MAEVTSSSLVGSTYFSLDLQVKRKEERRAAPEVAHAIRDAIDLALEAREAGHTLQPLRTRALRPRRLRAVPGGRARGPRALRGGDRVGRRQHTGLGRRKWPGSTAPTAGCGDIDPCRSPCTCERLSTPSTEGYARIMLRGSTTLKTAVVGPTRAERGFAMRVIAASANIHEVLQHQGGQSGEIASARTRFVRVTSGWLRRHGRCRSAQQQSSADSGLLQGGRRTIHVRYKWRRGRWSHNREHEQHPTRGGYGYVHV